MSKNLATAFLFSLTFISFFICLPLFIQADPVSIIVDTDIGEYPDDVGALAVLHTLADRNHLIFKAIVSCNPFEGVIPLLDALNHYFKRPNIPLGITRDKRVNETKENLDWAQRVLREFKHSKYQNNSQAKDALEVYRQVLAESKDKSITIISIGMFTNLANLLSTKGDNLSSLTGAELVAKKVKNVIAMAGRFPKGNEWNILNDIDAAKAFLKHWPSMPIVFAGFELSHNTMLCGMNLIKNTELKHSPVKMSVEMMVQIPNHLDGCFDQIAAYVAVEKYDKFYDQVKGLMILLENGTNAWNQNDAGHMSYLVSKGSATDQKLLETIDNLMTR